MIFKRRSRSVAYATLFAGMGAFTLGYPVNANARPQTSNHVNETMNVNGTVTDESGDPIVGATVIEIGTDNGAATDIDGKFQIKAAPGSKLRISYIGYKTQEITCNADGPVNITLQESGVALDDVVVVGYGVQRKVDLTGSVVRADLKSLNRSPNSNILQSLQGTVPGLNLGQATSAGGSPEVSIRGTNTLSGSKDILVVLDGIIYTSSLSSINPEDIESIDVLKDASSTAVYGAQAANGVLLITTKKGTQGKTKISLTSSYTISNPTHNYRPMNRDEYLDNVRALNYTDAFIGPDYTTPNPDFDILAKLPDTALRDGYSSGIDYSWWDEGTQNGHLWETRLSISGGNDNTNYFISYSHTDQAGFIKNDNFKRNSVRINLHTHIAPWWTVGVQAFGSFVNQDGAEPVLRDLIAQSPLIEPYDAEGKIKPYPFNTLDTNPFMGSDIDDYERHNYFSGIVTSEITFPLKGLKYRINYGNNYRIDKHNRANEYGYTLQGEAYKEFADFYDYTIDNILSYNNTFAEKHHVDATLLYGASEREYSYTKALSQGFTRLTLGYNSLEQGTNQYASSDAYKESLNYQMARLSYRFMSKYLVTGTIRRDGFSGFAANNKYATFPSMAIGWIISEEDFFKVPCINYLKLRAGYGISGNQTSRYKSQSRMLSELRYIFGDGGTPVIAQEVIQLGNKDLKWEKSKGYNLGLDFSLFNQRLTGAIEFYNTTTNDLLYDVVIPNITGFSAISSNIGKIRNRGFELSMTSQNIINRDFSWSSTLAFSTNSNKIITLTGEDNDGDGKEDDNIASNLFIGHSIGTVYGYKVNGIYQLDDEIPEGFHPGNYRIADTDGDGYITPDDRVILGKAEPAFRISLMNNLRYKNFNLSFLINAVSGGKNGYLGANSSSIIRDDNNTRWNYLNSFDYWSPQNPDATYARSTASPKITPTVYEDRSFIRLQDVQLTYSFPKQILDKCRLSNLDIFFSAKNLVTLTKWHGWDPEANSTYWGRPVMRSFSFGLSVTY